MDGCVKANDVTAGVGLFEEMVQQQMRPSAITHSILVRLYQRAGYEDDATEAVAQLYQHHGIERPMGGDKGRHMAKKGWPQKSPFNVHGRGSQSPTSPMVGHGYWGDSQGLPPLPSYGHDGCMSSDMSSVGTPVGTPMHSNGIYLPIEAVRHCVPQMQGHMSGMYAPTPTGCLGDQSQNLTAFGMPASPCMHPVGSPVAAMMQGQPMNQWMCNPPQWMCNGQMCNGQMYQGVMNGDGSSPYACGMPGQQSQQVFAVPVPYGHSHFNPCGPMQGAPFPMPLSPPHDMAHSSFPTGPMQPGYCENWGGVS